MVPPWTRGVHDFASSVRELIWDRIGARRADTELGIARLLRLDIAFVKTNLLSGGFLDNNTAVIRITNHKSRKNHKTLATNALSCPNPTLQPKPTHQQHARSAHK